MKCTPSLFVLGEGAPTPAHTLDMPFLWNHSAAQQDQQPVALGVQGEAGGEPGHLASGVLLLLIFVFEFLFVSANDFFCPIEVSGLFFEGVLSVASLSNC